MEDDSAEDGADGRGRRASVASGGIGITSGEHKAFLVQQTTSSRKIKELGKGASPGRLFRLFRLI